MTITANEIAVLRSILRNDFTSVNGAMPANYAEASDWVWANCINDSSYGSGIEGKSLSGVVSSLCQKGLVQTDGHSGRDGCVRLTEAGYNAIINL